MMVAPLVVTPPDWPASAGSTAAPFVFAPPALPGARRLDGVATGACYSGGLRRFGAVADRRLRVASVGRLRIPRSWALVDGSAHRYSQGIRERRRSGSPDRVMERQTATRVKGVGVVPAGPEPGTSEVGSRFFAELASFVRLRAVKLHRLQVDVAAPVPRLPCLDHEAALHEGIVPRAAAYVEDPESGELHELELTPSRRRIRIDPASTLHEYTEAGQARLVALLRTRFPDFTVAVDRVSWLRGDRRVARACRAQVTLREVLLGADLDRIDLGLERLRAVAALMEKHSRVASWSVRTVTGPLLAAVGFVVYQGLGRLAPELGEPAVAALQALVVGVVGAVFLYYGLRAVHLTEMANRVWKRAAEYGLIIAERRRLAGDGKPPERGDGPADPGRAPPAPGELPRSHSRVRSS